MLCFTHISNRNPSMFSMSMLKRYSFVATAAGVLAAVVGVQAADVTGDSAAAQNPDIVDIVDIDLTLSDDSAKAIKAAMNDGRFMLSGFEEFVDVTATADLDTWDKAVWTAKWMFQKKSFDELLVLYGYPLELVCKNGLAAAQLLKTHGAFILPAISMVEESASPEVQIGDFALAYMGPNNADAANPLVRICDTGVKAQWSLDAWDKIVFQASRLDGENDWVTVERGYVGAELANAFNEITTDEFITQYLTADAVPAYLVTADPLSVIDPATEIWAQCNVDDPKTLRSACRSTLEASSYYQHKAILDELGYLPTKLD